MEYVKFVPTKEITTEDGEQICFCFVGDSFFVDENCKPPTVKQFSKKGFPMENMYPLGFYKGVEYVLLCPEKISDENTFEMITLRDYSRMVSEEDFQIAGKAFLKSEYFRTNQYCGVCGTKMQYAYLFDTRVQHCNNCGNNAWPRVSNAVIVAVTKGDRLLMAHNKNFPSNRYSVLAGFVEYGECAEDAVRREIFEEVNIKVKNIRYFGSQAWPFPNSYMLGFTAEYESGEIEPDNTEIESAGWFTKEEVRNTYTKSISISSKLIEWFLEN